MKKYRVSLILILILCNGKLFAQLPISKQAIVMESGGQKSETSVLIEATGIYDGKKGSGLFGDSEAEDVKKNGAKMAKEDAKKAAVYVVILGGRNPLISKIEDRNKFTQIESQFFDINNITKYIKDEEDGLVSSVLTNNGKSIQLVKRYEVDRGLIGKDLIDKKIILPIADIVDAVGKPQILILPHVKKGEDPSVLLEERLNSVTNSNISEWLQYKEFDLLNFDANKSLQDMVSAQQSVGGREEDMSYNLALQIGSDVYVTFKTTVDTNPRGYKSCRIDLNAFETTTASSIGSSNGSSEFGNSITDEYLKEAANKALEKLVDNITKYWQKAIEQGQQYKLTISIDPNYDEDQVEDIKFGISDILKKIVKKTKLNNSTKQTLDYLVWVDKNAIEDGEKLWREIKKNYTNLQIDNSKIRNMFQKGKLIVLKIDPN